MYAAAAQLEAHLTSSEREGADEGARVAAQIYSKAFENYQGEVGFVLHYLNFLEGQREHSTMRTVRVTATQ